MHVAFGRQPFGRRCELDVVRAASDDAVARLESALDADPVSVPGRDVHVSTGEPLTAHMDEHVRPPSLQQHGGFWHGGHPLTLALVEHGRARLTNEQLAAWVLDFELDRQRACRRIDYTSVVDVMRVKRHWI